MKRFLTALALASIAFGGAAEAKDFKEGSKVRIATEGAYAPWNFTDSSGKLAGFEVDLYADLCERMKVQCELLQTAWEGIIPALQAGKFDAIMAGMSITDKRKEVITFSRNYMGSPASLVVLKSSPLASFDAGLPTISLADVDGGEMAALDKMKAALNGKTVGVQISTTHENFLNEYMAGTVTVKTYDTQENLDLDLAAGRIDAALASLSYWVPLLEGEKGENMKLTGPKMDGGPFGNGVGAGIRQDDQELADMFTVAIDAAIADGTISKLSTKWFGFDGTPKD
ncbi:transporter substrate-binding domain-containing protein [Nisaea acidiphila]|uniref:Transporter substrate-binding domain-containing protein n=1 Tax=Nisaea acidiphila TaxID=1862145 RepID=A0A9J7AYD8_9PROT|nr:transporter substrate-binding domain-containing protein [Nisaea acidiphila]UUX51441.1 transporter substrate-binding domain-containing protein [Nisaea acidiphila]